MIKCNQISKKYGDFYALNQVDLTINKGEVYGFLGHNGAGKTTMLSIIMDLIPKDGGQVIIEGAGIGFVPEHPVFYDFMTLKEYYQYLSQLLQPSPSKADQEKLIDLVGLRGFEGRKVKAFSRGMKQRAAIGAALLGDPEILLLDEPTSALDPEGRKLVVDLIRTLKQEGKTIVLSSHILKDIEEVCDRVGIIKSGQLLVEESLEALLNHYASPVIALKWTGQAPSFTGFTSQWLGEEAAELKITSKDDKQRLLQQLQEEEIDLERFELMKSTLEEIYLQVVSK